MPAAGYLVKKSHDLEICTRPTCHGILGDGIRKKMVMLNKSVLNYFRHFPSS